MNPLPEFLNSLTQAFKYCSLPDPIKRKQGENSLISLSFDQSYPISLLYLISNQSDFDLSLRSSIELKKWAQNYEKLGEYDTSCLQNMMEAIKANIIEVLGNSQYKIALQIAETIYLISKKEFPEKWRSLAKTLAINLKGDPCYYERELVSLKTMLKIFKKYEYSERSDPLYEEIILVCDETHDILLSYVRLLVNKLYNIQNPSEENLNNMKLLKTSLKIFYCLNFQDLHPNFENNLNLWMGLLGEVLKLQKDKQVLGDDVLLFKCKGEAMRAVLLYATKYREEFEGLITSFSQEIWNICSCTTEDNKFDKIVLNALKYFKSLIMWPSLTGFFSSNLSLLINTLIIPNLRVSKKDQLLFKEEPENFIDVYFNNNGELSSRRSVTVELMRSLAKYYKVGVNEILQTSCMHYIEGLKAGTPRNLETEITVINLFCEGASISFRPKEGVTEISVPNELILYLFDNLISGNLIEIYQDIISKKVNFIEDKYNPLHLSYFLRFIFYFRIYLPKASLLELAKLISFFLNTKNETLLTIVYYTLEAIIDIREGDFKMLTVMRNYFHKDNIQPQIQQILENIYQIGQNKEINNYLLKLLLVIIRTLGQNTAGYTGPFTAMYQNQLDKLIKGYTFQSSFLIFESIGTLINYSCKTDPSSLELIENYIVPHLNNVFNKNLSDLLAFVLQIYAIIVQNSPPNLLKETYSIIYNSILDPKNWIADNSPIFPAYTLYLEIYMKKFPNKILETASELQKILLFLLGNQQEALFFNINRTILNIFEWNSLISTGWFDFIFQSSFSFYSQLKSLESTTKGNPSFIKEFYLFLSECFIKYDPQAFFSQCEQSSNGLLKPFLRTEQIVLRTITRRSRDRKLLFIGLINLLYYAFTLLDPELWSLLFVEMVQNINNRRNVRARVRMDYQEQSLLDSHVILGNNSGFQRLSFIDETKVDLSGYPDEEKHFVNKFNEFHEKIKGVINIAGILSIPQQELLMKIMNEGT